MCCSMAPAQFSGTIVYVGEVQHPVHGLVHVLGYQNTVVNLAAEGPNAMILHIPAGVAMTQSNFIDTSRCKNILRDMVEALRPRPRGRSGAYQTRSIASAVAPVHVFDLDVYTVVLSEDASLIPEALSRVPEEKRPAVNQRLFDYYSAEFPGWSVALCCFNNREASSAAPMLMQYKPMDERTMHWPALDSHTGEVPDVNGQVDVSHWIIAGSHRMDPDAGVVVDYRGGCNPDVSAFLPDRVIGREFKMPMQNGDFTIDTQQVAHGLQEGIRRLPAPSAVLVG